MAAWGARRARRAQSPALPPSGWVRAAESGGLVLPLSAPRCRRCRRTLYLLLTLAPSVDMFHVGRASVPSPAPRNLEDLDSVQRVLLHRSVLRGLGRGRPLSPGLWGAPFSGVSRGDPDLGSPWHARGGTGPSPFRICTYWVARGPTKQVRLLLNSRLPPGRNSPEFGLDFVTEIRRLFLK